MDFSGLVFPGYRLCLVIQDPTWPRESRFVMLLGVAALLLVLWALGFFAVHIGGGFIHVLIVIAVVVLILHFVRGRGAKV